MFAFLKKWILPPRFDDEARTVLAARLFRVLHAVLLLSIAFSIPFTLFPNLLVSRFTTIAGMVVPFVLILLEVTRRGWVQAASISLLGLLWVTVTLGAATAGGVRAPIFMGYLVIIVIAGFLMGSKALLTASALSIVSGFGLAYADDQGLLPPASIAYTPYAVFLIYSFFSLSVLILQQMNWQTLQSALTHLQDELRERQRVEHDLTQRAREMFLLYQMGKALTGGENLYQALRALVVELKQLMTVDAFYVGLYNEVRNEISFPLYISGDREISVSPRKLDGSRSLTAYVLHTQRTLHLPDVRAGEVSKSFEIVVIADSDIRTYIGIPLINEGRILGILSVQARRENAYTEEQVQLLETLASQAAIAVEKYNLLGQLQKELNERKQMETALRESEARLRAIINQFPYDLWVCDAQGRYLLFNRASEKSYPSSPGKTALEVEGVPLEIRLRWQDEHERVLRGETIRNGPFEEVVNGEHRSFIVTIAPIVVDEKIIGLTGLSVDVTELRRAEEAARQLNAELEQRVVERTAALEQANRELQAFSYSISHDLRAPLRAIRSFGQILKDDFSGQLDPPARNYLDKILQSAQEMSELIDSLLVLFRMSKADLRPQPLDLSAEAHTILETLQRTDPERIVRLRVDEGLIVNADASLVRNALENLLGNAWKYTARTPQAVIEFGAQTVNGERVYFVRDNGAGFDMRYADKLFQPFQRLHRADEYPGHGIGLATVQRIIQRHGGRIWAESSPGQGATFYFTLGAN